MIKMNELKQKYLKRATVRAEIGSYSTGGVEVKVPEIEKIKRIIAAEHDGSVTYVAKPNGTGTDPNDAVVQMVEQGASSLAEVASGTSLSSEYINVTVEGY